jgi:NAD(P)-dependent dehydrogenase (short-subunit alcohol dehydrogenase family)
MSLAIDLSGQVALVTGVSSGIGAGVARMLAQAGCHVAGCGRSAPESKGAMDFRRSVELSGGRSLYCETDVTHSASLEAFVEETILVFGKIDILVTNAGVNVFEGAEDCPDERWQENLNLNLASHWQIARLCKPCLQRSPNGTIIIMTSNHAFSSIPGCFPYNVTKTALLGLVRALAIEWGPKIRTVGVAPGFIDTPGNDQWFNSFPDPAAERNRTVSLHPVAKLGTPDEVGALCAFLASSFASFISGTTYLMDGGRSALMQDS